MKMLRNDSKETRNCGLNRILQVSKINQPLTSTSFSRLWTVPYCYWIAPPSCVKMFWRPSDVIPVIGTRLFIFVKNVIFEERKHASASGHGSKGWDVEGSEFRKGMTSDGRQKYFRTTPLTSDSESAVTCRFETFRSAQTAQKAIPASNTKI